MEMIELTVVNQNESIVEQKEVQRDQEQEQKLNIIEDMCKVLGRRWTVLILSNLHTKEAVRFNELKRSLTGISSAVLSNRLLEMDREGLISRRLSRNTTQSRIPID